MWDKPKGEFPRGSRVTFIMLKVPKNVLTLQPAMLKVKDMNPKMLWVSTSLEVTTMEPRTSKSKS
jgi:hypothetical protein